MSVNKEQAFELFSLMSEKGGLPAKMEQHPESFGSRLSCIERDGARLRLVWDGKDEYLSLEISHGPSEKEQIFWLELYGAKCPGGTLPVAEKEDLSFRGSVQYGLELMHANGY